MQGCPPGTWSLARVPHFALTVWVAPGAPLWWCVSGDPGARGSRRLPGVLGPGGACSFTPCQPLPRSPASSQRPVTAGSAEPRAAPLRSAHRSEGRLPGSRWRTRGCLGVAQGCHCHRRRRLLEPHTSLTCFSHGCGRGWVSSLHPSWAGAGGSSGSPSAARTVPCGLTTTCLPSPGPRVSSCHSKVHRAQPGRPPPPPGVPS